MGRAMLILAASATIIFGMVQLGLFGQKRSLAEGTANYATDNQVKNAAYTVIQLAMEEINKDNSWEKTKANPWIQTVDGVEVEFYFNEISSGAGPLDPDIIRVYSKGFIKDRNYNIISQDSIISTFSKQPLDFVPSFEAALSIATEQFTFNMGGSSSISGTEKSGTCSDKPGITVPNESSYDKVIDGAGSKVSNISNGVSIDPNVKYSPVDELIARLATLPGTQTISGNYKGSLGTAENPGVFFVENYAKLTGGLDAGYGIMVIRSGGELTYEGELSVAGNFEFNGLIVFENAFDFTGRGTPDLNGSVLVGNTSNNNDIIDIDISGNLSLQYDCKAEEYAKRASSNLLKQNRYIRLNTFE